MPTSLSEIENLFNLPFNDLVFRAQTVHREHFDPNQVQVSTLLSIKTGGCSEDCKYCSQSARYDTGVEREQLLSLDDVLTAAQTARDNGATRFCMGAAWRGPKPKDMEPVLEMVKAVKSLGLETCATLGQLRDGQAEQLADAGLDYYNHNLDTSEDYYSEIVQSHTYEDRLNTLKDVRAAGMKVCCGGIVGMGESRNQRVGLLAQLAAMEPQPESVPINLLVRIPGTPMGDGESLEPLEFVRTIAVARIVLPRSLVRLSAGRQQMPDFLQALCFLAGANSIFYGEKLLTTPNPETGSDMALFETLGLKSMQVSESTAGQGQTRAG